MMSQHKSRSKLSLIKRGLLLFMAVFAGFGLALTMSLPIALGDTTVVVKPSQMNDWGIAVETGSAAGNFSVGPATPPLSTGSVHFTTASSASGVLIGATVFTNTRLDNITTLQYSTYQSLTSTSTVQATSLQFNIDNDLTDGDNGWKGRLVFEPYYTEVVTKGTWQTWDTMTQGKWWGTDSPISTSCSIGSPCTWSEVLTAFPNAGIHSTLGAVLLKAGSGWPAGFDGNVDALVIGVNGVKTTFDFEPETPCTTTCYVDNATGDDAFGGDTPASAKKTIPAALGQVNSGGSVIVAAGIYTENVTISKDNILLQGAGVGQTVLQGASCTGTGITLSGSRKAITITDITVTGYQDGIAMPTGPLSNMLIEDIAAVDNCRHGIFSQAFGIDGLTVRRVNASDNNDVWPGRGIWVINGVKQNITIEDGVFDNNYLVGIDISDGNATNLRITGNQVISNGDSGIGVLGPKGSGSILVDNNTVVDNGRFGIEIKNPAGNGASSGAGSVVVSNNVVSRTVTATDARDHAGIAVFRRYPTGDNADQPSGVVITGNRVSGYLVTETVGATGEGFGIVIEGNGHTVAGNTLTSNDIGLQLQAGNPSLNQQNSAWFDRGDALTTTNALISNNIVSGNTFGVRSIGPVTGVITANTIYTNTQSGITVLNEASTGILINNNRICQNGVFGVENQGSSDIDATHNWWNAADGPGPVGPGSGDKVSTKVVYSPFATFNTDPLCLIAPAPSNNGIYLPVIFKSSG